MLKRCLLILLSMTAATTPTRETKAQETKPQELKGKEASEFLKMASAKIKANCDAIKSWKGTIEAQHNKVLLSATFTIAANGDVLVYVDEMSGHQESLNGVTRVVERGRANPLQYEYFVHGESVESVMFPRGPAPPGSGSPHRIEKNIEKAKFRESIRTSFLNPQQLFEDTGKRRFDRYFETMSKAAHREDSTAVVTKPAVGETVWTVTSTFKSGRNAPESEPKLLSIWRLDETLSFLPVSYFQQLGDEEPNTKTHEYERNKDVLLPKTVVFSKGDDRTQFAVLTTALNEGPEKIDPSDRK
jgi:hypothetical protein